MKQLDISLSSRIHAWRLGVLDYALVVPGMLFGVYAMPVVIVALGLWLGWRIGALAALASVATLAVTNPLKRIIGRPRPAPLEASRAFTLRSLVSNPSFPSGDSAQAASVATLLVLMGPLDWPVSAVFLAAVPLCMFSRVYFGAHWVGDTLAGALIGGTVGLLCALGYDALAQNA